MGISIYNSGEWSDEDELMNENYNHLLLEDMKIVKTGKSASIRIEVPKLTLVDSLESQRNLVVTGMKIGKKLLSWCEKNVL